MRFGAFARLRPPWSGVESVFLRSSLLDGEACRTHLGAPPQKLWKPRPAREMWINLKCSRWRSPGDEKRQLGRSTPARKGWLGVNLRAILGFVTTRMS